ncbi:MAG: dihydropteroate synthase [Mesorhizobium sp.]|nr:dihydropteroate synthase [Mesorhizobium sp.]
MNTAWQLAHGRQLELGGRAIVMGILNVTPDSFSDGGDNVSIERAVEYAGEMAAAGAAIIDVGGESTRPGADAIDAAEEQRRVMPVIEALGASGKLLISIDTYREATAQAAVKAGAHAINDVWGLQREPGIARVAARSGAGIVVMHTGRDRIKLPDLIEDELAFFGRSLTIAREAGVDRGQIVLDPGFGFAKDPEENLELMARFDELSALGLPLMAGTSRKRFLGHVTGRDARGRDVATAVSSAMLRLRGAAMFRVHDVAGTVDALKLVEAVAAHRAGGTQT